MIPGDKGGGGWGTKLVNIAGGSGEGVATRRKDSAP